MFRQLLVARSAYNASIQRQAGFLTYGSLLCRRLPRFPQWHSGEKPSDYSDEFAQDLHLFPYYLKLKLQHLSVFVFGGIIT
jgi:hypothetical protein